MKKEQALSIILDSKTINIVFGPCAEGMLKQAIKGIKVSHIRYPFNFACLPQSRTKNEFDRCNKIGPYKLLTYDRNRFTDSFNEYDRIIVWHDGTASGKLLMGLLCMTEILPLLEVNTDKRFKYTSKYISGKIINFGGLKREQIQEAIKFLKPVSERQKEKYISIYKRFSATENELKINVNGKIMRLSDKRLREIRKEIINSSKIPVKLYYVIGQIMGKYDDYDFGTAVYTLILADMIHRGELFVTSMHMDKRMPINYNPFANLRIPQIIFEGNDVKDASTIFLTSSKKHADNYNGIKCLNIIDIFNEVLKKSDDETFRIFESIMALPNGKSYEPERVLDIVLSSNELKNKIIRCNGNEMINQILSFLEYHSEKLAGAFIAISDSREDIAVQAKQYKSLHTEIYKEPKYKEVMLGIGPHHTGEHEIEITIIAGYK